MRLTNYHRDAFVSAAMADVPQVPYRDQAKDALQAALLATAPKLVQECAKKHRSYLDANFVSFKGLSGRYFIGIEGAMHGEAEVRHLIGKTAAAEVDDLMAKHAAQDTQRDALESKLRGVATACTTRKALLAALPEFEKYLPPDVERSANLPALANVVSDFMQAGWPKDKERAPADAVA